jgi:hypothetical protein
MGKVHFSPKRWSRRLSVNVRSCLVQQHFASIWLTRTVVMRRYSVSRSGNYRRIGKRLSCVSKYNVSSPYVTLTFLTYKLLLFIPLKNTGPITIGPVFSGEEQLPPLPFSLHISSGGLSKGLDKITKHLFALSYALTMKLTFFLHFF